MILLVIHTRIIAEDLPASAEVHAEVSRRWDGTDPKIDDCAVCVQTAK